MSQQELNTPPPMAERTKQAAFIPRQQVASPSREPEGNSDSLFPKQHHDLIILYKLLMFNELVFYINHIIFTHII